MLSERFLSAVQLALQAHGHMVRKSTAIPYACHPLGVCSLTMEYGGDEDDQIAGLFHDLTEDTDITLDYIREHYGDRVAALVDFCSEKFERLENGEKPHWKQRKQAHINELKELSTRDLTDVEKHGLLVKAADMVHNARSTLQDFRAHGDAAYEKFNGGKEARLWYMREVARYLAKLMGSHPAVEELQSLMRALDDIEQNVSSILRLSVCGQDLYYDASTDVLQSRAFLDAFRQAHQVFEMFGDIEDDYTIERLKKDMADLEALQKTMTSGAVPPSMTYGIAQEIRGLPKLKAHIDELNKERELLLLAMQNDSDAARQLLELRKDSVHWELVDLQSATE